MENIKNLTPAELVELVETWYKANKEKRSLIMMVGEEEADSLTSTQMIGGRRYPLLTMLVEFLNEQASLVKEAALFSCVKAIGSKLGEKENQDSKNRES